LQSKMKYYHVVSYHFRKLDIPLIGKLFVPEQQRAERLPFIKEKMQAREWFYLSTCNRVECHLVSETKPCPYKTALLLNKHLSEAELAIVAGGAEVLSGKEAVRHIFSTASSLNSMVTGEREIITQVRRAFEQSRELGLTGDFIRLLLRQTIETAKQVFTETSIARKPVSVVSLAYSEISKRFSPAETDILLVGAGQTITHMVKLLTESGYKKLVITNRTDARAQALAAEEGVDWLPWKEKQLTKKSFQVVVSCTGSELPVISTSLFHAWTKGCTKSPLLVDLALPPDAENELMASSSHTYIGLSTLQEISEKNMSTRRQEMDACDAIIEQAIHSFTLLTKERSVELAMGEVPEMVKQIRQQAMEKIFAKDLSILNDQSMAVVEKILDYMEKKYIALPIKKAKEVLLEKAVHES